MSTFFDKDELVPLIKYFPVYLILIGSLRMIIFYKFFNIRIIDYLDFSEILFSFFDTFLFYFTIFILPALLFLTFFGPSIGKANLEILKESLHLSTKERFLKSFKENKFPFILIVIGFLFIIIKSIVSGWNDRFLLSLLFILFLIFGLIVDQLRIKSLNSNFL
ncbi:hypothetical protein BH23BAC1_BH23BAC1_39470 [soil metagenome]